jgi:hypothetical protein
MGVAKRHFGNEIHGCSILGFSRKCTHTWDGIPPPVTLLFLITFDFFDPPGASKCENQEVVVNE